MNTHPSLILITAGLLLNLFSVKCLSTNEIEARLWFDQFNKDYRKLKTYIHTPLYHNKIKPTGTRIEKIMRKTLLRDMNDLWRVKRAEMGFLFNWKQFKDERLKRMFSKAADLGIWIVTDSAKLTEFDELKKKLSYGRPKIQQTEAEYIKKIMTDVGSPETEKKHLWQRWRNATGKPVRAMYQRFVDLSNEMIKQSGYDNYAQYWQSQYEPKPGQNFEKMMADIFDELLPFYKELHGYVKYALKQKYPGSVFPPTGQIPGHILGDVWGYKWENLESFTKPFPNESYTNITKEMINKDWTVEKIFETSENFFKSLGLGNIASTFWEYMVISDVDMNCYHMNSVFFINYADLDNLIKLCTEINKESLLNTHITMGRIHYLKQYNKLPFVFRGAPNPGFYTAITSAIELFVMSPSHLQKIGLLSLDRVSNEFYINYMYRLALLNAPHLLHAYLLDHWRYKVFKGEVSKNQLNTEWENLRCKLLGVSSPVLRSEEDFDPGTFNATVSNRETMGYFIGWVLQFQFHKSLCNAAGVTENIHKCSIYNSSAAGTKLNALLEKGSSMHWEDLLFELSGTRKISAEPLLEYFEPLRKHIRDENKRTEVKPGWNDSCPSADWYAEKSGQRLSTSWWGQHALFLLISICVFLNHFFI